MVRRWWVGTLVVLTCTALAGCAMTGADPPKAAPEQARAAEWSVTPSDRYGPIVTAQVVDSDVVVVFERGVAVLDRGNGKQRWSVAAEFPGGLQPAEDSVRVTADAVVVLQGSDNSDEAGTATVHDLATGKQRGSLTYDLSDGPARVAVTADTLVAEMKESTGAGDDRYTIESVDLDTGRSLWKRTYGHLFPLIEVSAPGGGARFVPQSRDPLLAATPTLVLLSGYEKDGAVPRYRTRVVDPRTGRTVGAPFENPDDNPVSLLDDKRFVMWDDESEGCGAQVTGYQVANAKPVWKLEAAAWRDFPKPECHDVWAPLTVEGRLLTYTPDERPVLVDPADGKAIWTGPEGFHPIGVTGQVVVGRDSRNDNTVVAYHLSGPRRMWKAPDPGAIRPEADTVVPGYAILNDGIHELWTYQLKTGNKLRCEGGNRVIGAGDGWMIAGLKGDGPDGGRYALRYFKL